MGESLGWLNHMIEHMWPFINEAITYTVKTEVEPLIQAALPSAVGTFSFERFSLGDAPLRIDSARTLSKTKGSLELRLDVVYDGDHDISICKAGVSIGVKKFVFKARLTLVMKPLVPLMPIVGAVHVGFVNPPSIDFDFSGLANVLDFPLFSQVLRKVIRQQIANLMVLPNRITVKLAADAPGHDIFSSSYVRPMLLKLTVVGANDLKNCDDRWMLPGKSDPYAIVQIGPQEVTTATIKDTLNPTWNETHEFLLHSREQTVNVILFDADPGPDDHMGTAIFSLCGLTAEPQELTAEISYGGTIKIRAELCGLRAEPEALTAIPTDSGSGTSAVLAVLVDQAFGLDTETTKSAQVRVTVGDQVRATRQQLLTRTISNAATVGEGEKIVEEVVPNPNPEWEQCLEFLLSAPHELFVKLELLDDTGALLGDYTCPMSTLLEADSPGQRGQVELQNGSAAGTKLAVTLRLFAVQPATEEDLPAMQVYEEVAEDEEHSVDWLDDVIAGLWPYIDAFGKKTMVEEVVPMVQAQLPSAITFSCERFSLGAVPFTMDDFQVQSSAKDSVTFSLKMCYEGDCDISLAVGGVAAGVSRVKFIGHMSLLMRPLINRIPVVAAVQVYYCNPPTIEMDFTGVADILDWALVGKLFRNVLDTQVKGLLVLPKRVTVMLTEDQPKEDLFWRLRTPALGVLRVTIVEAKGLKNADEAPGFMSFLRPGSSDPYCVVRLADRSFTTATIKNTTNPSWDGATYDFLVCDEDQLLLIDIYDDDHVSQDDLIGNCQASAKDLIAKADTWLPVAAGGGELRVQSQWLPIVHDHAAASAISPGAEEHTALVTVLVGRGCALPTEEFKAAQVRVTLGDEAQTTSSVALNKPLEKSGEAGLVQPNPNPEWFQELDFLVKQPQGAVLKLEVVESGSTVMGTAEYALDELLAAGTPIVSLHLPLEGSANPDSILGVKVLLGALQGSP